MFKSPFLTLIFISLFLYCYKADDVLVFPNDYKVSAKLINDNIIEFTFNYNVWGYIGIGFGSSMTSSDMIVSELSENNDYTVVDRFATGHSYPKDDLSQGGKNDILTQSLQKLPNNTINIKFDRLLVTGDTLDASLPKDGSEIPVFFAYKEKTALTYHQTNKLFAVMKIDLPNKKVSFTKK